MRIYIPTVRKPEQMLAYWQLLEAGLRPIVVVDKMMQQYEGADTLAIGRKVNIAQKRQFIMEHAGMQPFCMVDDDLVFRKVQHNGRIRACMPSELWALFSVLIPDLLKRYAHGGVHPRLFVNSTLAYGYPYCTTRRHYRQVLCYNPKLFNSPVAYPTDTACSEDIWALVQLCMQGLDWFLITGYVTEEKEPKREPDRWTMTYKYRVIRRLLRRVPPQFTRRISVGVKNKKPSEGFMFRKMALANGAKG